jgi:hypothetical protein
VLVVIECRYRRRLSGCKAVLVRAAQSEPVAVVCEDTEDTLTVTVTVAEECPAVIPVNTN